MTPVHLFETLLLLMLVALGLAVVARRVGLPPAAAFVIGGMVLAFVPGTPQLELDPDLILILFLPPLLLSSAYFTVWRDFKANMRPILMLAIGGGPVHHVRSRAGRQADVADIALGCLLCAWRDRVAAGRGIGQGDPATVPGAAPHRCRS